MMPVLLLGVALWVASGAARSSSRRPAPTPAPARLPSSTRATPAPSTSSSSTRATPATPAPAWLPLKSPVTLVPGKRYRAHIELSGLEALFGGAADVAAKLQSDAGPWKGLRVAELGSSRYEAIGVYAGKQRAAAMPEQVKSVWVAA